MFLEMWLRSSQVQEPEVGAKVVLEQQNSVPEEYLETTN